VQDLGQHLYREEGAEKMCPGKQIAIMLWFLGNQEVYRYLVRCFLRVKIFLSIYI